MRHDNPLSLIFFLIDLLASVIVLFILLCSPSLFLPLRFREVQFALSRLLLSGNAHARHLSAPGFSGFKVSKHEKCEEETAVRCAPEETRARQTYNNEPTRFT